MPDQTPDPIRRLSDFADQGGDPMDVMSPAEIRRRGDRRRRRTQAMTAGVAAAAVLAVVLPLAALGRGGDGDAQPAPAPPSGPVDLAGVDLVRGMVANDDGTPVEATEDGEGVGAFDACAVEPGDAGPVPAADAVQRLGASAEGPEYGQAREVRVYADQDDADAALQAVLEQADDCASQEVGGTTWVLDRAEGGLPGDSHLLVRTYEQDGQTPPGAVWWQLTRVGRALVLSSTGAEFQPGPGLEQGIRDDDRSLTSVVQQVCEAVGEPCGGETDDEPAEPADTVPADFPLAAGWPEPSADGTLEGPSRDVPFVELSACERPFPQPSSGERLGARLAEPELYRSREVVALADAEAAAAYVDEIQDYYASCPQQPSEGGTTNYEFRPSDLLGDQSEIVVLIPADESGMPTLGLEVLHVVRVGSGVVLDHVSTSALAFEADIRRQYTQQADDLGEVVAAMCVFTDSGCGSGSDGSSDAGDGGTSPAAVLPLTAGWPEPGGDYESVDAFPLTVCGDPLPEPEADGTLASSSTALSGPEDYRSRRVTVFDDAEQAVAYADQLRAAYEACPEEVFDEDQLREVYRTSVREAGVGGQSFAAVRLREAMGSPAPGLESVLVVRLGRAVLIDTNSNEGGAGPDPEGGAVATAVDDASTLVEAMCLYTEDGC